MGIMMISFHEWQGTWGHLLAPATSTGCIQAVVLPYEYLKGIGKSKLSEYDLSIQSENGLGFYFHSFFPQTFIKCLLLDRHRDRQVSVLKITQVSRGG